MISPSYTSMVLIISSHCNLRCGYCFADQGEFNSCYESMDVKTAFRAVDWFLEHAGDGGLTIDFGGGEPLLEFEILRETTYYAQRRAKELDREINFKLTTNGTIMPEHIVNFLKLHKFSVAVSIDSKDSAVHDANRPDAAGNGTYARAIETLNKFSEDNDLKVQSILTHNNLDFTGYIKFFSSLPQIKNIHIGLVACKDPRYRLTLNDAVELEKSWDAYGEELCSAIERGEKPAIYTMEALIENLMCLKYEGKCAGHCCDSWKRNAFIAPNGKIYSCDKLVGDSDLLIGDVENGLDTEKISELTEKTNIKHRKECLACDLKDICGGNCYFYAKSINGSFNSVDPAICKVNKAAVSTAIQVISAMENASNRDRLNKDSV